MPALTKLTRPVRFVHVGEVAIVLGRGATEEQLQEALVTARAAIGGNRTVLSPCPGAGPFSTLNNDEDGTDRGPQCTRCGRDVAGIWCQACFQHNPGLL